MSIADLIEKMAADGAPLAAIVHAVRAIEERDRADAERRAKAAERKRRQRDRERDSHGTVTGQSQDSPATSSPPDGPLSPNPSPPLNPPATGSAGQGARASADPDHGESLLRRCQDALGDMASANWAMFVSGDIEAAVAQGVDIELDLIPAFRAKAEERRRKGGKPFTTWEFPLEAAIHAKNRRLSMAAAAKRPPTTAAPTNRSDRDDTSRKAGPRSAADKTSTADRLVAVAARRIGEHYAGPAPADRDDRPAADDDGKILDLTAVRGGRTVG